MDLRPTIFHMKEQDVFFTLKSKEFSAEGNTIIVHLIPKSTSLDLPLALQKCCILLLIFSSLFLDYGKLSLSSHFHLIYKPTNYKASHKLSLT